MPKNSILENFLKYSSSEFTPRNNYARGLLGISGIAMGVEVLPLGKSDNVAIPLVVETVLSFIL